MSRFELYEQRWRASGPGRWYAGRERNEQHVILALVVVFVLTVLWLGIWKPVSDWREVEHNRFRNAQSTLDWMRANEARAREVARAGGPNAGRSLIPVITRSAETQGLILTRLQPESSGAVSVVLQGQRFNDIVRWLQQLEENNGVAVARVAFDADPRPGFVNAQIRLQ